MSSENKSHRLGYTAFAAMKLHSQGQTAAHQVDAAIGFARSVALDAVRIGGVSPERTAIAYGAVLLDIATQLAGEAARHTCVAAIIPPMTFDPEYDATLISDKDWPGLKPGVKVEVPPIRPYVQPSPPAGMVVRELI